MNKTSIRYHRSEGKKKMS